MINDEELNFLLDIDSELTKISQDLKTKTEISSIYKYLLTWKTNHIRDIMEKKEKDLDEKVSNHKKEVIKNNIFLSIIGVILIIIGFLMMNVYLFLILIPILIASYFFVNLKLKCKNIDYALISIEKIYQILDQINKYLNEKKVLIDKETKKIQEDLVLQIFNQASIDLEKMTCTENINLNFKDRAYRNFIIDLYDLKLNEKELNNFYRKVIKIILQDDLQILEDYSN